MIKKFIKRQIEKFENRNQLSQEQKNKLKQLEDEFALQIEWFPKELFLIKIVAYIQNFD